MCVISIIGVCVHTRRKNPKKLSYYGRERCALLVANKSVFTLDQKSPQKNYVILLELCAISTKVCLH